MRARKPPSNLAIIVLASIVLTLGLLYGFTLVNKAENSLPSEPIAQPEQTRKLEFELDMIKGLQELRGKNIDWKGLKAEAYVIKGMTQEQVVNFYKSNLPKAGWNFEDYDRWFYFRKGSKGVSIGALPLDRASLAYNIGRYPKLNGQLEENEVLVIIVQGSFKQVRLLGL